MFRFTIHVSPVVDSTPTSSSGEWKRSTDYHGHGEDSSVHLRERSSASGFFGSNISGCCLNWGFCVLDPLENHDFPEFADHCMGIHPGKVGKNNGSCNSYG